MSALPDHGAAQRPADFAVDISEMRLGDRMAYAWWTQQRRLDTGERRGLIDRHRLLREPFPLARCFPDTFVDLSEDSAARLPPCPLVHLWISVTNAFALGPQAGQFEHLPEAILARAAQLREDTAGPRVLIHQRNDATYNRARNWLQRDTNPLTNPLLPALAALGLDALRRPAVAAAPGHRPAAGDAWAV